MNKKPNNISQAAQLIEGIGASSWFTITKENDQYRIERFSVEGELECSGLFINKGDFDINSEYQFTYISHCKECTIIQNEETMKFYRYEY